MNRQGHRYSALHVAMVCHDTISGLGRVHELMQLQDEAAATVTAPFMYLHPDLRDAALNGVIQARRGMASPPDHHGEWVRFLAERGWRPGPKNPDARTHPNLVPWEELSPEQQDKDRAFLALVVTLTV
jgi:hypothetical protein